MILIYKTKPEHIQQILFSGFGKYEQTNKLGKILRNRNHDTIRNKFDKENKD
jgi:hypothetical protein